MPAQSDKFDIVGHYNLVVKNVDFGDHGEYVCDITELKNHSAALTVIGKFGYVRVYKSKLMLTPAAAYIVQCKCFKVFLV